MEREAYRADEVSTGTRQLPMEWASTYKENQKIKEHSEFEQGPPQATCITPFT